MQSPRHGITLVFMLLLRSILGWIPGSLFQKGRSFQILESKWRNENHSFERRILRSTPFEADLYNDNPYDYDSKENSIEVPPDTKLVLGVNKYSHDTTICAADAKTGKVLFALSKERLSRRKHDGGTITSLVESCLTSLNLQLENIERVVVNNHHHRVIPIEANLPHMEWENGLFINAGADDGYTEPENRLPIHQELSHHLAHAYSTAAQAPFDSGMCVVMDGMGETYRTMKFSADDPQYVGDFSFKEEFQIVPSDIEEQASRSVFDFREAESVYVFNKTETGIDLRPVFKRFTPERSPPTLYNHGFENMESLGALYSRASSHIFGDWNACGKVMGLAPWANSTWTTPDGRSISPVLVLDSPIMWGNLYSDGGLKFNKTKLEGPPIYSTEDPETFDMEDIPRSKYDFDYDDAEEKLLPTKAALRAIGVAHRIQTDLEVVAMDFVKYWKEKTGEKNLCLAGGVCLNSVLNGRLSRELGFQSTFVSPYPGDEGVAVGCCAHGLFENKYLAASGSTHVGKAPLWNGPLSVYLGPSYGEDAICEAIESAEPWIDVDLVRDEDEKLDIIAKEVEMGMIVAWYQSRSEMGPRALGHRSIIADPRKKDLVRFINESVKGREGFRPFAPSVLAEEANDWFELNSNESTNNMSPYMSITAFVREDKQSLIPAVTHVDGTSRLQTIDKLADPLYHKLISKFYELTKVPMILNTSFNTLPGEPIVESPKDAIRSFLCSMGAIKTLIIGDFIITRRKANLRQLLGEVSKSGIVKTEPVFPMRTGPSVFESTTDVETGEVSPEATNKVTMPSRPMHGLGTEWFEFLDELEAEVFSSCDGNSTLNEIMAQYQGAYTDEAENEMQETEILLQNVAHRMVRLFEQTLIGW